MDFVLKHADHLVFDSLYGQLGLSTHFARDAVFRQALSLWMIATVGGAAIYFIFGSFNYYFIFDHELKKHPKYLPNQVRFLSL
jgi:lathosterol oxidase